MNFDPVFHGVFYPSKEDLMTKYRIIVTTLVTAGRYVMKTYTALVVLLFLFWPSGGCPRKLGRLSLVPRPVRAIRMSGGYLQPTR